MKRIYIFISYGHDKYANRTRALYEQLQQNDENFVIWWDDKLEISEDWIIEIEKNLNNLIVNSSDSSFIYVITPYSSNVERDNFCIKEIVKALGNNVRVIPVRLAEAPMPLLLGNIQWIDFTDIDMNNGNAEFINRTEKLCEIIRNPKKELPKDGKQAILRSKLEPCSFTLELKKHLANYEARQWLLGTVKDWIESDGKKILLLVGGPGTGKTAFSIWMSYSELSQYVCAWHLCQYSNRKGTCDLRSAVKSMAYFLSTRIPEYYRNMDIAEVERILQKAEFDENTLFKELILSPLCRIDNPGHPVVILIDAIDEATENNNNDLADIIHEYVDQLPQWLKIIVTSRNDSSVMTFLRSCSYVVNFDDVSFVEESRNDVNHYVNHMLEDCPQYIQKVIKESGNNFLYAQLLCNTIKENPEYALDELPSDINAYYYKYLRRYFVNSKFDFDTQGLPLLLPILTSYEPISKDVIYEHLHQIAGDWCVNRRVFESLLQSFGPLLKEVDDFILPFHKSLFDWFLDEENKTEFSISKKDGLEEMVAWGVDVIQNSSSKNKMMEHFYLYLPQYMIEADSTMFESLYFDMTFWEERKKIIGVNLLLKTMIDELALCKPEIRQQLFNKEQFFNIIYQFNIDLFNTGRYANLCNLGYEIPMTRGMDDKHRLFVVRNLYINEQYKEIDGNIDIFEDPYKDHIVEANLLNELGQTYRKLGQLEKSAMYYRKSLNIALEYNSTVDEIIYTRLNLSRILTLQCKNQEARQVLDEAVKEFDSNRWQNSMQGVDYEFSSQQLIRGVRYVELETENFSTTPNLEICEKSLKWANEIYAILAKRDRYYANHLIGKLFYNIKNHHIDNIDSLLKESKNSVVSKYDGIRLTCVHSLLLLCQGKTDEALQMATKQLNELYENDMHPIQCAELAAIIGYITKSDKSYYVTEELHPWYNQVQRIIQSIIK